MIKAMSILALSIFVTGMTIQDCYADEYDQIAAEKAQAERQKEDQEQYLHQLNEINSDNRAIVNKARELAQQEGGKPKNLLCYEGVVYQGFDGGVGATSDYTWQTVAGVPVGTRIPRYTTGNIIGAIAMSPFTIGAALHGSSEESEPKIQHTYPAYIGRCRFRVGRTYCSVTRYVNSDGNIDSNCLK